MYLNPDSLIEYPLTVMTGTLASPAMWYWRTCTLLDFQQLAFLGSLCTQCGEAAQSLTVTLVSPDTMFMLCYSSCCGSVAAVSKLVHCIISYHSAQIILM